MIDDLETNDISHNFLDRINRYIGFMEKECPGKTTDKEIYKAESEKLFAMQVVLILGHIVVHRKAENGIMVFMKNLPLAIKEACNISKVEPPQVDIMDLTEEDNSPEAIAHRTLKGLGFK